MRAIEAVAGFVFTTVAIIGIVIFLGVGTAISNAYDSAKCGMGNQIYCYYNSYNKVTIEHLTPNQVAAWNEMVVNNGPWEQKYYMRDRRWSLLRTEWLDGEVIQTRQLCVIPTNMLVNDFSGQDGLNCFYRTVLNGKHKGQELEPRKKQIGGDYRTYMRTQLMQRWNAASW